MLLHRCSSSMLCAVSCYVQNSYRLPVVADNDKLSSHRVSRIPNDFARSTGRRLDGVYAEVHAMLNLLSIQHWQDTAHASFVCGMYNTKSMAENVASRTNSEARKGI